MKETTFNATKKFLSEKIVESFADSHDEKVMLARALIESDYFTEPTHVLWYFDEPHKYQVEYDIWKLLGLPMKGDEKWNVFVDAMSRKDHKKILGRLQQYGTVDEPEDEG